MRTRSKAPPSDSSRYLSLRRGGMHRRLLWATCTLTAGAAVCTTLVPRDVVAAALQDHGSDTATVVQVEGVISRDASEEPRIRIQRDARIEQLIADGLDGSSTFRTVVDRLNRSDVVVYVRCQHEMASREDGYLKFVSSVGGFRYLQAHIRYNTSRVRQISLIGHELFHAVEVADAPAVIDVASFERQYARIGFVSRTIRIGGGIAYDTHAAIRAGEQILRELST